MTTPQGMRIGLVAAAICTTVGLVGYRFGRAHADGAPTMQPLYYGGVLDDGGRPVEGSRNITVRLWDAATGGTAVCTTVSPNTPLSGGRFRVALEASCGSAVQANPDLWAEVIVDSTTFARQKLGAVPYALEAARAAAASGPLATRIASLETAARPRQVVVVGGGGEMVVLASTPPDGVCPSQSSPLTGTTFTITPNTSSMFSFSANCFIQGAGSVRFSAVSSPAPVGLVGSISSDTRISVSPLATMDRFSLYSVGRLIAGTPYTVQIAATGGGGRPSDGRNCGNSTIRCENIIVTQLE